MMNPAEFANIAKAENDFWWYRGQRRIMFGLLDPVAAARKFRRVLEAGAGTGHFAKELEQRYGWPMYPLDLGWEGLEYAKTLGVGRLTQGDIQTLPYRDGAFDAVVSMDVIVHLPRGDESKPLNEFRRVLAPGGFLALRASALDILRSHHSEFAMERQRFTRARLMRAAEAAGARIFERTRALAQTRRSAHSGLTIRTATGSVNCRAIALCGNATLDDYVPSLARKIMPVGTYVIATEPLPAERARALIKNDAAVSDANWILDYFRLARDHRLLFHQLLVWC